MVSSKLAVAIVAWSAAADALATVGSVDRNDSVELVSDDDELAPGKKVFDRRAAAVWVFGGSSNVSRTLADVIGVRYRLRLVALDECGKSSRSLSNVDTIGAPKSMATVLLRLAFWDRRKLVTSVDGCRFSICSLGEVRTLSENSAYSTSFSPEMPSSSDPFSSSELSFDRFALFATIFFNTPTAAEYSSSYKVQRITNHFILFIYLTLCV